MKRKIVFLCHFSNSLVRDQLDLKDTPQSKYDDFAIWVSDYIQEFEKHNDYEFWIVAPHRNMRVEKQTFERNGIHYCFFKCDNGRIYSYINAKFRIYEKTDYRANRKRIKNIIDGIQPHLVILCGAENPYYSLGVLDIKDIPVYVILQTLLNDPKRIEMGVGTPYRRKSELRVFCHARYFGTSGNNEMDVIRSANNEAVFLPTGFPSHRPIVHISENKDFDFVFFARAVKKNKGVEDLLKALSVVKYTYPDVSLNIIGGINDDYKEALQEIMHNLNISRNVHFSGYYLQIQETYENVVKARAAVVPGITAALNSTVRESMLMGLPTICYESSASENINKDKKCLITAKMEDVEDLARQMILVLDHPEQAGAIALSGKEYAERVFSNEAIVNRLLDNCRKIIEKKV